MEEFQRITGESAARAKFYLDACNNQLQPALDMYYEGNRKIRTLDTSPQDVDDDINYFAGGDKSGVLMKGRKADKAPEVVQDILQQAEKSGPLPDKPSSFKGTGYKLNAQETTQDLEPVERTLTFWKNGFSIDDGPLKRYDDPENEEFLRHVKSGRAPTNFLNVKYGQPVEVKVSHKLDQDYVEPPKKMVPFSGSGQRLGAPIPSSSSVPGSFPQPNQIKFQVDESLPFTSIQIRLADGSRLVSRFNHIHTVGDIRRFIIESRPEEANRPFLLMTNFPNKELKDDSISVKDAGLLNAVVSQKV